MATGDGSGLDGGTKRNPYRNSKANADPDTCFVSLNANVTTDYSSSDATAVQMAVDDAFPGDTLKIAGTCTGVELVAGILQTVYISKTLDLKGGYDEANWGAGQPLGLFTTTLDTNNLGRVAYVTNNATVTFDGLLMVNGYISNTMAVEWR